jgi:hypothetical protein
VALRYAEAVTFGPERADDALWAQLHASFNEQEIMELGRFIGGIRWVHTLGVEHRQIAADGDVGLAPALRASAGAAPEHEDHAIETTTPVVTTTTDG